MDTDNVDELTFDEAVEMLRALNVKQKKLGYDLDFEMDGFNEPTEWSDQIFLSNFWSSVVVYRRPERFQISVACKYFLIHYTSGTGNVEDWEKTLRILLLALKKQSCWILSNGSCTEETQSLTLLELPTVISDKKLKRLLERKEQNTSSQYNQKTKWAIWCLSHLIHQKETSEAEQTRREDLLSTYLGYLSLCFISKITKPPRFIEKFICENITDLMLDVFGFSVFNGQATPSPNPEIWSILEMVFKRLQPFSMEIVTRLTKRRMEAKDLVEKVQNEACYLSISNRGLELLTWFFSACKACQLSEQVFIEIISLLPFGLEVPVKSISNILPKISPGGIEEKTWSICRLLSDTAHCNFSAWCPYNFLTIAFFVAIATSSKKESDKVWFREELEPIREYPHVITAGISLSERFRAILNNLKNDSEIKENTQPRIK